MTNTRRFNCERLGKASVTTRDEFNIFRHRKIVRYKSRVMESKTSEMRRCLYQV